MTCVFLRKGLGAFLFILSSFPAIAQAVVATAGDHFSGGDVAISWTLGEGVIETFEAGDVILTQGFHQPSLMITAVGEAESSIMIKAFPNPTGDVVMVRLPLTEGDGATAVLFDPAGRRLRTEPLSGGDQSFSMQTMTSGLYFLVVYRGQSVLKSFRIVKK